MIILKKYVILGMMSPSNNPNLDLEKTDKKWLTEQPNP